MNLVEEIETLGLEGDDEVKRMLKSAVARVIPIMKKRSWKVSKVKEFFPQNQSLLGLNKKVGVTITIYIKVRRSKSGIDLFPFEHTLGTLLHELCHIQIGPHDQNFYNLLDQLWNECEENKSLNVAKGMDGNSEGHKLDGMRHNPSALDARRLRLQALEKRMKLNKLTSLPPKRLGGSESNLSLKDNILLAVERRLKDDQWCQSEEKESEPEIEQIIINKDKEEEKVDVLNNDTKEENSGWVCDVCTLLNPTEVTVCVACENVCPTNSQIEKTNNWMCEKCTFMNSEEDIWRCRVCQQAKSNYGTQFIIH